MLSTIQKRTAAPTFTSLEKVLVPALAVGTALTLDQLKGLHANVTRRSNPEFHTARPQSARHTLGVLPGCQTNGKLFFESLVPLTPDTALVATDYAQHGFRVEAVCEGLAKHLLRVGAERPSLLCQSMGGMVMREFLHYAYQTGVAEKLGGFSTIILDSSPFDFSDVRDGSKRLLGTASAPGIRTSFALDFLKRQIYSHIAGPMSAGAHLDTISSEGKFMQQPYSGGMLPDIMDAVYYVHGPYDHVVDTSTALPRYEAIVPAGKFFSIEDNEREYGDHTASNDRQSFQLRFAGVEPPQLYVAA